MAAVPPSVPAVPGAPDAVLVVYTDGACSGNPGPGGWAWAVPHGPCASGSEARTTNQRMEVHAVLDALATLGECHPGPIEVVSDSTYVVNCFRDGWWKGWLARGWKNSQKQPVANRDLWEPLIAAVRARADGPGAVRFRWVKGHGGDPFNDKVDRLAVAAAQKQSPRAVDGALDDLPMSAAAPPDPARAPRSARPAARKVEAAPPGRRPPAPRPSDPPAPSTPDDAGRAGLAAARAAREKAPRLFE